MATNHTTNYHLNTWEPGDSFLRSEFNENFDKLDAALKAVDTKADGKASAAALNALTQTVNTKGNCYLVTGSYVGTGEYGQKHPCSLSFTRKPMIIFLATNYYNSYSSAQEYHILTRNLPSLTGHGTNDPNMLTWTEYGVSWYVNTLSDGPKRQYNELGKTYEYIALLID